MGLHPAPDIPKPVIRGLIPPYNRNPKIRCRSPAITFPAGRAPWAMPHGPLGLPFLMASGNNGGLPQLVWELLRGTGRPLRTRERAAMDAAWPAADHNDNHRGQAEMLLQRKLHIETRKEDAERKLTARLETLKAQGLDGEALQKDPAVRQIRAAIRQARRQMARIAEIEEQDRKKAEAREQKRNAPREARAKAKKADRGESPRKARKEKKATLASQEK